MKLIDVLNLMAEGKVEEGTELRVHYDFACYVYKYQKLYRTFLNENHRRLEEEFVFGDDFLNFEVELIPSSKEKKYLIKLNIRGLKGHFRYLNYYKENDGIQINSKRCTDLAKTHFTKSEMQSIRSVREFLEDMDGKYELIEVEENEIYK